MALKLRYTRDELVADHPYARPHEAAGYRLHGGFLADGAYASPRTFVRWPAVRAWRKALEAKGDTLIDTSENLLAHGSYPTVPQHKALLAEGYGKSLWNSLTITGIIEARGKMLATLVGPDVQKLVVEDISDTATGHLNAGLLYAHGVDEGGDPAKPNGPGAHDFMWFAARDEVLGKNAYAIPEPPASIARPQSATREMPQLPEGYEQYFKFLMNVLMIEVRAEAFFATCCALFRDPEAFADRRENAERAALMIERIRTDEEIHVAYLQLVVSELRTFTFKTGEGALVKGEAIIDPVWKRMVDWHGREERVLARERSREDLRAQLKAALGAEQGAALFARFDALEAA